MEVGAIGISRDVIGGKALYGKGRIESVIGILRAGVVPGPEIRTVLGLSSRGVVEEPSEAGGGVSAGILLITSGARESQI